MRFDTIIIGGGAAGLFCALTAGARGRRALVLEHNREVGAKIVISGGGRCNFTNIHTAPDRFISANPHFARSALARYGPGDFLGFVERHAIAYYEKTLGQLFCEGAGSARKIVKALMDECAAGGVVVRTGVGVSAVSHDGRFRVETSVGAFEAETLVIATGGLSIPKMGATNFAFRMAQQFGVPIVPTRPGLVPVTFDDFEREWMAALSGVSTPAIVRGRNVSFREAVLFTHRGLSGPAILQISSYLDEGGFEIDWLADAGEDALVAIKRERPAILLRTALGALLPARLAEAMARRIGDAAAPLTDLKDVRLFEVARSLKADRRRPIGTEGYAKAEVTVGGIDTDALSQRNMSVRAVPGLFFIGECVDVTGWLGGYNFQWAWASGWCAGGAV